MRDLEVFRTLADSSTITEAALTLHLSQSQLSRILRDLERRLGVPLFDRSTAGLRLTTEGQEFARTREMRAFTSRIAGDAGELRVSVLPSMAFERMAIWTNRFRERHPRATLTATDDVSGNGITAVMSGDTDVAISAARLRLPSGEERPLFPESRGVTVTPLVSERFHLVAPASADLPRSPSWEFALAHLGVGYTATSGVQRCLERIAAEEGVTAQAEMRTNSPLTIAGLVEAGLGWSIVPTSNLGLMRVRDLATAELPGYERVVCIVIPEVDPAPLARHFVDSLLES
jgi:DNA-binding transcriptional LysR family regulator